MCLKVKQCTVCLRYLETLQSNLDTFVEAHYKTGRQLYCVQCYQDYGNMDEFNFNKGEPHTPS